MIDNEKREELLNRSPSSVRVTQADLDKKVASAEFHKLSPTLTVCVLTTQNGFQIVGKSACADPVNYNKELGEKISYDDAFKQLWALEGYLLRETVHQNQPQNNFAANG